MTDKVAEKSPTKRIYRSPELRVYGDIHRITQANDPIQGQFDNAAHTMKTGPD